MYQQKSVFNIKHKIHIVLIVLMSVLGIGNVLPNIYATSTQQQYKHLSSTKVEYTDTLGFDFYEHLIAPGSKDNGRGEPIENLVSNYGESYINDELLREDVIRFRRWEWKELYESLNEKANNYPKHLNIYRLQAEVYLVNKNYKEALSQLDKLLRIDPMDKHALTLSILASKTIGEQEQFDKRLAVLQWLDKELYQAVSDVFSKSDGLNVKHVNYGTQQLTTMTPDAIAVFGQSPNPNGSVSSQLLLRLQKAKEMAEKYPKAKLVLTGGPVRYAYAEADVMAKWLIDNGIAKDRLILDDIARDTPGNAIGLVKAFKEINAHNILVVATVLHLPRATTVLTIHGEAIGYPMTIDSVGGDEKSLPSKKEEERIYTYVNAMRAAYLYTKEDFDNFKPRTSVQTVLDPINNILFISIPLIILVGVLIVIFVMKSKVKK